MIKLSNRFQSLDEQEGNEEFNIEERWKSLCYKHFAEEVCGKKNRRKQKPWFDEDCKSVVNGE